MKKAYFQYYETFESIVQKIKEPERDNFRRIIINYGLHGEEPQVLSEIEDMAWGIVKDLIDQQKHRREINAKNREKKPAPQTEKTETKAFKKPTIEEVEGYCQEKKIKINTQAFYAYYEANGWKVGRNSMKSWPAAVQSWAQRDKEAAGGKVGTLWGKNSTDAETAGYEDLF